MVMVKAPPAPADTSSLSDDISSATAASVGVGSVGGEEVLNSDATGSSFEQVDELFRDSPAERAADLPASPNSQPAATEYAINNAAPADPKPTDSEPLLPNGDWLSPSMQTWKTAIWMTSSVVLGIVTILGVGRLIVVPRDSLNSASVDSISAKATSPTAALSGAEDVPHPAEPPADPPSAVGSHTPSSEARPVQPVGADEGATPPVARRDDADVSHPVADPGEGKVPEPRGSDKDLTTVSSDTPSSSTSPGMAPLQPRAGGGPSEINSSSFGPQVDVVTRYRPVINPPRRVDVARRLADPIPSIELREMRLVDFLRFMSRLSTIPITLEPEALPMIGLAASQPISVTKQNATVEEVLKESLQPIKLAYEVVEGHLFVRSVYSLNHRLRPYPHEVSDLVAGEQQRMATLVDHALMLVAPESWRNQGDTVSIVPELEKLMVVQSADVHYQLHLFLQKLRVARGQPARRGTQSTRFRLDTRTARAGARLQSRVHVRLPSNTPFLRTIAQLEELADVILLVDWHAAARLGVGPETPVTLSTDEVSLQETLHALLDPMRLTYRAVDEMTLQITSEHALARRPELEFYAVGDLTDQRAGLGVEAPQLVDRIRRAVGEEHFPLGSGLAFDADSQCLLALLPQPQQRIVAEKLAQWRSR